MKKEAYEDTTIKATATQLTLGTQLQPGMPERIKTFVANKQAFHALYDELPKIPPKNF